MPSSIRGTEIAPGIIRTDEGYHYGTKAAFIAAGLAPDGMFPRDPGQRRTYSRFQKDGREVNIYLSTSEKFRMTIGPNEQERKADAAAGALEEQRQMLSLMPSDRDQFRAKPVKDATVFFAVLRDYLNHKLSGFYYDQEVIAQCDKAESIIMSALRAGAVHFDPEHHEQCARMCRAIAIDADPQFATMMDSIVGGATEADHG